MEHYIKALIFIIVMLVYVHPGGSFLPTRLSAVSDNDHTMEDIIREGIYKVLLKSEGKELVFGYVDFEKADTKLLLEVWEQLERSILEIVDSCNLVDITYPAVPVWSFADEQIMEGHELLMSLRERLLQTVGSAKPSNNDGLTTYQRTSTASFTAARETLGHIFHLVLMFYSNTNWVELGHQEIYKSLGVLNTPLIPVSPNSFPTCEACGRTIGQSCVNNLLVKDFLTSGYIGTRHLVSESSTQLQEKYGKCRHGGTGQDEWNNMTVSGGINKQSTDPRMSPHYSLHDKAAQLAIQHIAFYLEDQDYGLRHLLGDAEFNRFFFGDREVDDNTLTRERRDLSGMDFYHLIADTSGGTVYKTDKDNIAAVVDIIKDSVSTKPPVTIMKFKQLTTSSDTFNVPVDELITNLTIKVQNPLGAVSSMHLYRPDGTIQTFGNSSVASEQKLGIQLIVIRLYNPVPGIWRMQRTTSAELDVDVTASTDLEFTYTFMQTGPGGFGEYPLTGRPIAGDNTTVQVFVPMADALSSVDSLLLLDRNGAMVDNVTLHNVGGRRGKTLFKTYVVLPSKEFEIAIEGKDKSGNNFRRLDPKMISTLDIQLKVLPTSGTLYINENISIPYEIRNVGGGSATIHVSISDDKGFARSPLNHSHTVPSAGTAYGSFSLHAGALKGETTTVTISAKIDGSASNKVQYSVQRITVEERVIRVFDKKAPICNVTSTSGLCNFGSDVCQCSSHTWEMSAVVGDDGDGLQSVFASNAGNSSTFTVDSFSPGKNLRDGLVHAKIRADCCHQQAKITVVDLAGNVGLCEVRITPGFVAPDPKLCMNPAKQQASPTVNATTISCNVTQVVGFCNGSTANSSNWCERVFWNLHAVLGSEGFGHIQVAPVNAGMQANLTRTNNTLILSADCCHPDVYINAVDIAGNTGQCHATITVADNMPNSSAQQSGSSSSIAIIAGSALGGVVAVVSITLLVIFLKKRLASSVIQPRTEPSRTKY